MPTAPKIKYDSYEEYGNLREQALQKHLDAVPELLDFSWVYYESVSYLGHNKSWLGGSCEWFMIMTKGQGKEWCEWLSDMLLFSLKRVLYVICEYNKLQIQSRNQSSISSNVEAVRLVKEAVESFFDQGLWRGDFIDTNFTFNDNEVLVPIPT
jgi:hypothetical protein